MTTKQPAKQPPAPPPQEPTDKVIAAKTPASDTAEFSLKLDYADEVKQSDQEWMERSGLDHHSLCGAIESIIFISDRPVKTQKLRDHLDPKKQMPLRVIHESIARLQQDYEQSHHGIRLVEVGEGFQFRTKASYAKVVQSLFKSSSLVLGPTALEVMAIIAYRQPISRTEIDQIRGVDSSHILRILMDKRLVQVCGRSKDVGKPVVYGTTREFLEMFNLTSLQDLPPEHELNALADNQDLGDISDIKELVSSSAELHDKFNFDEIDELDELAKVIKEVSPDTAFTKSIRAEEKKRQDPEATTQSAFELLEEFVKSADTRTTTTTDSNDQPTAKAPAAPSLTTPPIPQELAQEADIGTNEEADALEAQLDRAFAKLTAAHSTDEETDSTGPEDDLAPEKSPPPPSPEL